MMMEQSLKYRLDKRDVKDLHTEIDTLAKAYTPEWHFTTDDPDIASVIGIIFADQMASNIERFNQMLHQYHTAFVNLLGVSLRPAMPATAVIIVELVDSSVDGAIIRKGTQFIGGQEGSDPIIFETVSDVYVTAQNIKDAFMVSGETGAIRPLLGEIKGVSYLSDVVERVVENIDTDSESAEVPEQEDEAEEEEDEELPEIKPFRVFDFPDMGIAKNAVLLFHEYMMDTEKDTLKIEITGKGLLDDIESGKIQFMYPLRTKLAEVESVTVKNGFVLVRKSEKADRVVYKDREYDLLVMERSTAPKESLLCEKITFSSEGAPRRPEYLGDVSRDEGGENFKPFGEELALFKEGYIGADRYFSKAGSRITLSFKLKTDVHYVGTNIPEDVDLRPIKRKPKFVMTDTVADSFVQEIAIEYFNGTGWKRLDCNQDFRALFAGDNHGSVKLSFRCPSDMTAIVAGGYNGRAIRMVVLKADNCYMSPCNHHYPVMSDVTVAYTYEGNFVNPQKCVTISGTQKRDVTAQLISGKKFTAFNSSQYEDDAIYLGFGARPAGGPVSMYVELDASLAQTTGIELEYSCGREFKSLRAADHTGGFSSSGIIYFMPPDDFSQMTLEGRKDYWIRLKRAAHAGYSRKMADPVVKRITMNALDCENIYRLEEEPYYMDEVIPYRSFDLYADQIYDADVWVNELKQHNQAEMYEFAEDHPEMVRMERDFIGNIMSFFVKWTEVDNFNDSVKGDRHYVLDRMNSRLHFGDGVHVMIPRETEDVAIQVGIRVCQGAAGNLGERAISQPGSSLLFVGDVYNPVPSFGGTDVESLDRALIRGANRINGRGRLITEQDYVRELKSLNPNFEKVKCIPALAPDGSSNPEILSIVTLVSNYRHGGFSFNKEKENVKKHLINNCELAIDPDYIEIREPVLVAISVELWLEAESMDDCYMVIEDYRNMLDEYLDPIKGGQGDGWDIGVLPAPTQIRMRVNTVRTKAAPSRINIVASYSDKEGLHEVQLEDIEPNPYFVGYSGEHKIHIDVRKQTV